MITRRLVGRLISKKEYEKGYIESNTVYYNVIYIQYRLFDIIPIWRVPVFLEDVPSYAVIGKYVFGGDIWSSCKPWLIDAANKNMKL